MIRVERLCYRVGAFALEDVSLEVGAGEYFVLLGPTGSGKTLLVECLCGLLRPLGGRIEIDGLDVTRLAPRLRGIGYVPQHQALFPHLSVRDNIAFPLRARHVPRAEVRRRLGPFVELLRLEHLLARWPMHLSGGERQKVALARALVAQPRLVLLDEPVSALDESTREHLCAELRRIHGELDVTTIHISHSVEEALSVADRAGVIHQGRLVQAGPLRDLISRPVSEFVARFFRAHNIIRATAEPDGDATRLTFAGHAIRVPGQLRGAVTFVIRPEALEVHKAATVANAVPAVLRRVSDHGPYRHLEFDAGIPLVTCSTAPADTLSAAVGEPHTLVFPPDAIHVLP